MKFQLFASSDEDRFNKGVQEIFDKASIIHSTKFDTVFHAGINKPKYHAYIVYSPK